MDDLNSFNRRRHSIDAVALANIARQGRRVSFGGQHDQLGTMQPQGRRHSVLFGGPPNRRMSVDPRTGRRQSRSFSIFSSFGSTTFSGLPMMKPITKQENTYKMVPDEGTEFKAHIVRSETKKVMEDVLGESTYMTKPFPKPQKYGKKNAGTEGANLAKNLTTEVKDRLKELDMKRYKFVVNAFVGDDQGQGLRIASSSLWNTDTDGYISVEHHNDKHFAVVVVHAVYFE